MARSLPPIVLLLALSACAPTGPDPGYAEATGPFTHFATQPSPVPPPACPKPGLSLPCANRASNAASPALFNAPTQGMSPAARDTGCQRARRARSAEPSVPRFGRIRAAGRARDRRQSCRERRCRCAHRQRGVGADGAERQRHGDRLRAGRRAHGGRDTPGPLNLARASGYDGHVTRQHGKPE